MRDNIPTQQRSTGMVVLISIFTSGHPMWTGEDTVENHKRWEGEPGGRWTSKSEKWSCARYQLVLSSRTPLLNWLGYFYDGCLWVIVCEYRQVFSQYSRRITWSMDPGITVTRPWKSRNKFKQINAVSWFDTSWQQNFWLSCFFCRHPPVKVHFTSNSQLLESINLAGNQAFN